MKKKRISPLYRVIKWLVRVFYPKIEVVGVEHLPEEPVIVVGNHAQMHGPICCELYFPVDRYTWCAGEMMHRKEVPAYAFQDFWSGKPKSVRWFYRLLSYIIAPFSVCVFNNAQTIAVYHDARALSTFKNTVAKLGDGASIVIFPERNEPNNHIVCQFQDKFVDVAKLYHSRTKKELSFVPMYIAPALRKLYLGSPIRYCADNSPEVERERICQYLSEEITAMACSLPTHTVVPYNNIPKKDYPVNTWGGAGQ